MRPSWMTRIRSALQHQNAVVAAQRRLLECMRHDDARHAGQGQDDVRDLMRRLRVERGSRLVGQQNGGMLQKTPRDGDALLLPAGQPAAVFAAQIILPALGDQRRQTGELDGPIDLCRWELTEHCDIIPDRSVKNKDILLDHRNNVI